MKFIKVNKVLVGTALAATLFVGGGLPSNINPLEVHSVEASTKVSMSNKIMGNSQATAYQMAEFVRIKKGNGVRLQGATVQQLAQMYLEEGAKEGIRGDVAFAQAILETGYFSYEGSSVSPDQHNYAGIGTTGGGVKGHYFKDARTGVRAQIQHLKAYASRDALKQANVDPRFKFVTRGIAPNWQDLQGRWAMKQGSNYGDVILGLYNQILAVPDKKNVTVATPEKKADINSVVAQNKSTNYILTANLNLRATAGSNGKYITTINKNQTVASTKTQKVGLTTWHYVTHGKNKGWVSGQYLKAQNTVAKADVTKQDTGKTLTTKSNLNVRATAGTSGKYLSTLVAGTKVTSTKTQKVGSTTWHYVLSGKTNGWVSGQYLKG